MMITVEEAREKILGYVNVLEAESQPILSCLGQVLAEDIVSGVSIPPLDNSAMDGYAVRSKDTIGASQKSPRVLRVIDTVSAGSMPKLELMPGTAIRIMTGAPVPGGADSVVRFEDTDEASRRDAAGHPEEIGILCESEPSANIRRAGEDVANGSLVLPEGKLIGPAEVGLMASLGIATARVIRRPVVAVLATGDELVSAGQTLTSGKLYDSNSYSVAGLVTHYGGIPKLLGIAPDNEDALVAKLQHGLDADMFVTTGGVSMGDYDMVKDVLARQGEIAFWTVRMKPGKPIAFGLLRGQSKDAGSRKIPHLGLPGNPVSVMVTFELFARPALFKMMGRKDSGWPIVEAVIEDSIDNNDGRRVFARAILEKHGDSYSARLTGPQGSGILTSMSLANALVVVPENKAGVRKGDVVQAMLLDWGETVLCDGKESA